MHQNIFIGYIIGMEIGNFEVIRRFGFGQFFDLYLLYCNTFSGRKQAFISAFQLLRRNKSLPFYIERMSARTLDFFSVDICSVN